jgi:tRNA pseudouridine synthase 10
MLIKPKKMITTLNDKKILKIADSILRDYKICDYCFGRIFAKIETGMDNKKRGEILRKSLKIDKFTKIENCWLCSGLLNEIQSFADLVSYSLKDYDFDTFLIGTKVEEDIIGREKEILEFTGEEYSESIKNELNREVGKILENSLKKEVDFLNPTIMVILDTAFNHLELQIKSIYIYGRYKKFKRDIPQTKWFCKICRGSGCKRCNYTGKIYDTSVEELISKIFIEKTIADSSLLHGSGREDVDVKMLGNGRPFVLELKNPIYRKINFIDITNEINKVNKGVIEVSSLRFSNKDEVARLKNATFQKTYKAIIKGEKPLNNEKLIKATQSLQDKNIRQFTPLRVAHRRANMVREKHIYKCQVESVEGSIAILTIIADSGTYIKELITGDEGRTKPNISEIMNNPCEVLELDVIEIDGE